MQMGSQENRILLGAFFCVAGAFLPWHIYPWVEQLTGVIGEDLLPPLGPGGVPGYLTVPGLAGLLSALVVVILILTGEGAQGSRRRAGLSFFVALTVFLFFLGGLVPLFTAIGAQPGLGLLAMSAGSVLMLLGVRSGSGRG